MYISRALVKKRPCQTLVSFIIGHGNSGFKSVKVIEFDIWRREGTLSITKDSAAYIRP